LHRSGPEKLEARHIEADGKRLDAGTRGLVAAHVDAGRDMNDNLRIRIPADGMGALKGIRNAHERVSGAAIAVRRGGSIDKKAYSLYGLGRRRQNEKREQTEERP